MKKGIVVALSFLVLCSFTAIKPLVKRVTDSNKIEVVFNNKTSFDQLAQLKSDLHKKHIELMFNKLEFDENGLTKIDFSVDCEDGFKGGASADRLNNNSKFGFFRDYSKNASSPFGTGSID